MEEKMFYVTIFISIILLAFIMGESILGCVDFYLLIYSC